MKRTIRLMLLLMAAMVLATTSQARKNDDPDLRHVRLTTTDGKTIEGWIPRKQMTWIMQYQVVLADKPDAKKGKKYKAEKLQKMDWLTPTEEHPDGEVWERCQTIYRYMFAPVKEECLLELVYRGENALVYKARIFLAGNGTTSRNSWVTWYALKPNGQERAFLIYNVSLDKLGSFHTQFKNKEEYDGFKDFLEAWYDKDKKLAKKQVADSPAIISTLFDEWKSTSGK